MHRQLRRDLGVGELVQQPDHRPALASVEEDRAHSPA